MTGPFTAMSPTVSAGSPAMRSTRSTLPRTAPSGSTTGAPGHVGGREPVAGRLPPYRSFAGQPGRRATASPAGIEAMSGRANRKRWAGESARLRSCEAYIERSPTTRVAIPIASIAGPSIARLSVISATMSITASGAWATLPKSAIIATITNGEGSAGTAGRDGLEEAPDPGPEQAADDHPGPEDAAGAAGSDRERGREDLRERQREHDPQRQTEQRRPVEPRLDPAVARAEDAGEDERERADREARDGRSERPAGCDQPWNHRVSP